MHTLTIALCVIGSFIAGYILFELFVFVFFGRREYDWIHLMVDTWRTWRNKERD